MDKEIEKVIWVISLLVLLVIIFPLIYVLRHLDILFQRPLLEQLKIYVIEFNYYLVFYSIAVNAVYLILLLISYFGAEEQLMLWKAKNMKFLFKKEIVPSISIIAPAYNEEQTITDSVNSLMNLKYPNYELIVVNDGSLDNTLNYLINYYSLERVSYVYDERLKTMPVMGVYKNKNYPNLIVVDKENGGKADSLNTGINVSGSQYFCGIDADSLLEEEALLKLVSLSMDDSRESIAFGGNIYPINGCKVEKGVIKDIRLPKESVPMFQAIEYLRAFMAGRVGWATINGLLIISGAFGLFKKETIIEIGGYLSKSGKYKKDTVGEDMELVIRLSKHMREKNIPYKVEYAFNANCWTEVPGNLKNLLKQRDRWHRGLIDILSYHRKIIFNPRFGIMGLISFPYFFIFELVGPIVEIQGYFMVLAAFIFGILNAKITLLLFISVIFLGTLISVTSLLIAEKESSYTNARDFLKLILFSIIENFGFRQILSVWRIMSYFNTIKNVSSWGSIDRKGFKNEE